MTPSTGKKGEGECLLTTIPFTARAKDVLDDIFGVVLITDETVSYFFCSPPVKAIVHLCMHIATMGWCGKTD